MIPGKTFMPRSDSACNAADVHDDGESVLTRSYAEVLTVSPRAFSGRRLEWAPVAPGVNQHAPSGALATGNNEVSDAPLGARRASRGSSLLFFFRVRRAATCG